MCGSTTSAEELKFISFGEIKLPGFQVTLGNAPLFSFPAASVHLQTLVLRCNERKSCECNTLQ